MKNSRSNKRFRKSNKKMNSRNKRNKHSQNKRNKHSRNKRNKHSRNIQKGGNCGCGSTMHGGNLQSSPYYYPLNDHANDPLAPSTIISSRQLPDMKGGMNGTQLFSTVSDPFFNTDSLKNPVLSFGTSAGAVSQNNILTQSPSLENTNLTQANFSNTQKYLA